MATRFAVLLADEVLIPASSYVESAICRRVLDEYPPEIFAERFTLVGGGASFDEFLEAKHAQYRPDQAQGVAYRDEGLGISLPWRTRRRSSTTDIMDVWTKALGSLEVKRLFEAGADELPPGAERLWEKVPEQLGSNAFIVENVTRILFGTPKTSLIIRNRLHAIINRAYFGSYAKDLGASIMRDLRFLESPNEVPSGDPGGDLNYGRLVRTCRQHDVLGEINSRRPADLLALRSDQRFAAAYAEAMPLIQVDETPISIIGRAGTPSPLRNPIGGAMPVAQRTRVMIVTALPREAAAVLATFDDFRDAPSHANDSNFYREGVYRLTNGQERRVLLASLPTMGTDSAASVGTNAFRTHPDIGYALMVGIAGACPNPSRPEEHIRLGDVVVSDAKGVFDYGHIKRTPEADTHRGHPQMVSPAMMGAFGALLSEDLLGRHPWEDVLASTLAKETTSPLFRRPSEDRDVLHASKDKDDVVPHPTDPQRRVGQPRIHGGAIGTADILLKDPSIRDRLRDDHGVRAVEMEGSGMQTAAWLANRQFIVVRGACDYADTHKNDDWQHYAALTAASVARCLIERMPAEWFE